MTAFSYPCVSSPRSLVLFFIIFSLSSLPLHLSHSHIKKHLPLLFPFLLLTPLPIPLFLQGKNIHPPLPPICSVIQSWRQSAVAEEVSDDVLEENAGNSAGQSSPLSILSFLICCASIFKITLRINNVARACLLLLTSVAAVIYSK